MGGVEPGDDVSAHLEFLDTLPPVDFAFAYGSAAFPQNSRAAREAAKSSMVDYILAVDSPGEWHAENMEANRHHYRSLLVVAGGGAVACWVADKVGAGVYFNPYVATGRGRLVKYGVTSTRSLMRDLSDWDRVYVSGRMHKPIRLLVPHGRMSKLQTRNLQAAVAASLLALPHRFSEICLFLQLCGLSYRGDVRTLFGAEDSHKVKAIVQGNLEGFRSHYKNVLEGFSGEGLLHPEPAKDPGPAYFEQSMASANRSTLLGYLPTSLLTEVSERLPRQSAGDRAALPPLVAKLASDKSFDEVIHGIYRCLRQRVLVSSARQAVAGVITAGVVSSLSYVGRKMMLNLRSRSMF